MGYFHSISCITLADPRGTPGMRNPLWIQFLFIFIQFMRVWFRVGASIWNGYFFKVFLGIFHSISCIDWISVFLLYFLYQIRVFFSVQGSILNWTDGLMYLTQRFMALCSPWKSCVSVFPMNR